MHIMAKTATNASYVSDWMVSPHFPSQREQEALCWSHSRWKRLHFSWLSMILFTKCLVMIGWHIPRQIVVNAYLYGVSPCLLCVRSVMYKMRRVWYLIQQNAMMSLLISLIFGFYFTQVDALQCLHTASLISEPVVSFSTSEIYILLFLSLSDEHTGMKGSYWSQTTILMLTVEPRSIEYNHPLAWRPNHSDYWNGNENVPRGAWPMR